MTGTTEVRQRPGEAHDGKESDRRSSPRVPRFSRGTKVKALLVVAAAVFLIARYPVSSAHLATRIYNGIATFVSTLSS
ncbi:hypothetical protein GCM10029964_125760 [Kibdelosporangium lantanae]